MKTTSTRLLPAAIAIAALFASPTAAVGLEEAVVPPSNSAATQYTETFPTSGGDKKTDQKPTHRSPTKVLGKHNVQKLQKHGAEGQAAAETAAATAPSSIATSQPAPAPSTQSSAGASGNDNGGASAPQVQANTKGGDQTVRPSAPQPAGSSGIGAAIGQATGLSSSGQSGPLLPLAILTAALWSLAYLWRQRRQVS